MSVIYLYEPESKVSFSENRIIVNSGRDLVTSLPVEKVESIVLFGNIQLTGKLINVMLERGISIIWLSHRGKFFGKLESTSDVNITRQRKQFELSSDPKFCLQFSKKIISAKVNNQKVVIRRYNRNMSIPELEKQIKDLNILLDKIDSATSVPNLLGYEGNASRVYFSALSRFVDGEFKFNGRNKRPPRDRFNSMLSFAYTLLMYDIYTAILTKKLHPYAGFLHQDKESHPSLASDLMEEWRAVLADSMVLNAIHRNKIDPNDFERDEETGGIYMGKSSSKIFIKDYESKINTPSEYLGYLGYNLTFRRAAVEQANRLCHAIESEDPEIYEPIRIR